MNNPRYKCPRPLEFGDYLSSLYPGNFPAIEDIKTITFQVTENCCLHCSYCYQVHNTHNELDFNKIKPWIEELLDDKLSYINTSNTKGIIWEFIGGEPFLRIDLITQITDLVYNTMIEKNHPWLHFSKISISSNGILYFDKRVQAYLNKYKELISLGISLDGNKELHDKCRVDLEGNGSHDRVIAAVHHYKKHFGYMPNIKMTFAPENLPYLNESYQYLISEGYKDLHGNCVYEDVWSMKDATELYYQLKNLADYLIDNDLHKDIYVSFFDEDHFQPKEEHDNENWCGGVHNSMFAIDNNGLIYHCIRFMDSSLQGEQKPLPLGDIQNGFGVKEEHIKNLEMFHSITRRSQSTDECFYCPIAGGCSWCSGYNYQKTGTVNKRVTYICNMHKARSLANVYYWNKVYQKEKVNKVFIRHLSDEESLKIIPQDELNLLINLERG